MDIFFLVYLNINFYSSLFLSLSLPLRLSLLRYKANKLQTHKTSNQQRTTHHTYNPRRDPSTQPPQPMP